MPSDAGADADTRVWSAPEPLFASGIFAFGVGVPTVSPDGRELFVLALQSGGTFTDIFFFARLDATQPWPEVLTNLTSVNSGASDSVSSISSTGLELIITRGSDLYNARRDSVTSAWGAPVPLGFGGFGASLVGNDLVLYYEDSISCPGERCLRKRSRTTPTAAWGTATVEVLPDGSGGYQTIEVAQDELSVLLATPVAQNAPRIAIATRPSRGASWGAVSAIAELGAFPIRFAKRSPAGDEMYLAAGPAPNDLELYVSRLR